MQEQVKYATIIKDRNKLIEVILSDNLVAIGCGRSIYKDVTVSFNKDSQSLTIFGEYLGYTHCRYVAASHKWNYLGRDCEWSGVNDAEIYFITPEDKDKFLSTYIPFNDIYKKNILWRENYDDVLMSENNKATLFDRFISLFRKNYVVKRSFDCVSGFLVQSKGNKEIVNLEEYVLKDLRENKMRANDGFNNKMEILKD